VTTEETLDLALEALEGVVKNCWRDIPSWRLDEIKERITAIKQARSAPVQEPIGYFTVNDYDKWEQIDGTSGKPLYEHPAAQRTWVGLTQDEFIDFATTFEYGTGGLIRAIEAKLKEKNT
jgi:hypothetical protein